MTLLDTPTPAQEEILITLRALAGLVAQAVRQKMALGRADDDARALERANAEISLWRDLLLYHTRRLLPALVSDGVASDYRQVAEWLVSDVYLQDLEAIADHGCDPLTCTHPAHDLSGTRPTAGGVS
jgi:hypothetical protein